MTTIYKCTSCEEEYTFWNGAGFNYPSYCMEIRTKALEGKYGKEIKEFLLGNPQAVIDASYKVYYCEKCGHWEKTVALDCYLPKEEAPERSDLPWAVGSPTGGLNDKEYPKSPFAAPWELKTGYVLAKEYMHLCLKCGLKMKGYSKPPVLRKDDGLEVLKLKCKHCGGEIVQTEDYLCID